MRIEFDYGELTIYSTNISFLDEVREYALSCNEKRTIFDVIRDFDVHKGTPILHVYADNYNLYKLLAIKIKHT